MSNGFDDREKGFEAKYRHDEETRFRIIARRNRLLGLWAAQELDITGAGADAYAREVVAADFDEPGDADVVRKLMADFSAKGVALTEHRLRKEMERLMEVAREQVLTEAKPDSAG
jgi:hypothetical protein